MNNHTPNIFIVEDDKFFANMIKETLSKNSYKNISLFHSGEECIGQIHETPDVVILDYGLGSMNGIEVLKQIKSINPNIQVIFLSAQEKMDIAITSLKYGAFDYLEKSDAGLKRLVHLVQRIVRMNKMIEENSKYALLSKAFFATVAILIGIVGTLFFI